LDLDLDLDLELELELELDLDLDLDLDLHHRDRDRDRAPLLCVLVDKGLSLFILYRPGSLVAQPRKEKTFIIRVSHCFCPNKIMTIISLCK
jgi:hypothetical protein